MTGRVLDEAGRPIAGARVVRGSDLRGQEAIAEATTDAAGRFDDAAASRRAGWS